MVHYESNELVNVAYLRQSAERFPLRATPTPRSVNNLINGLRILLISENIVEDMEENREEKRKFAKYSGDCRSDPINIAGKSGVSLSRPIS